MWERREVEKIEKCMGEFTVACSFINVEEHFKLVFVGVYGPKYDCDGRFLWDKLAGLLGGICRDALGGIFMSLVFLVRDRVKPIFFQLWCNFQISFLPG
jgi:hypothetical protein